MDLLADRSRKDAVAALALTWLGFCLAVGLALPQPLQPAQVLLGAALGAVLVMTGFMAYSRWRRIPPHGTRTAAKLVVLSLLLGTGMDGVLLTVMIAAADFRTWPAIPIRESHR
jgi:hypothetical protein